MDPRKTKPPKLELERVLKRDLDAEVAARSLRPPYEVSLIVTATLGAIRDALTEGKAVVLPSIGTLTPRYRARQVPKTLSTPKGKTFVQRSHASMGVKFHISTALKRDMPKVDPDDLLYDPRFDPFAKYNTRED